MWKCPVCGRAYPIRQG
ncbi:Trm112 family protein [Blautia glucerasea]